MDLGLKGRVALVSGASKGLGLASAERLAREGAHLALCSRDKDAIAKAGELLAGFGGEVWTLAADVQTEAGCRDFVEGALERYGRADILVANAGGPKPGPSEALSDDDWRAAHDLTLMSVVRLAEYALPAMKREGWGRVVTIQSGTILRPMAGMMLSNALRMAVAGWAKTLAQEAGPHGVTVNVVGPGLAETERGLAVLAAQAERFGISLEDMRKAAENTMPVRRIGRPEDIADLVAFLASERAGFITGAVIPVDGGSSL